MKDFALLFRLKDMENFKPSPEQLQERMTWLAGIAAQNKLVDKGNSLLPFADSAKTLRSDDVITDGPFTEIKEFVVGYVIVRAESMDEAVALAKGNPVFKLGGSVEIREILSRD